MDLPQRPKKVWSRSEVEALGAYLDLPTAASVLGISRSHAYRLAKAGLFPVTVHKIGTRYRVPTQLLIELLCLDHERGA